MDLPRARPILERGADRGEGAPPVGAHGLGVVAGRVREVQGCEGVEAPAAETCREGDRDAVARELRDGQDRPGARTRLPPEGAPREHPAASRSPLG